MNNVIPFDSGKRATQQEHTLPGAVEGQLFCRCGSAWFLLAVNDFMPAGYPSGAVCFDGDGRLTGFIGTATCTECGEAAPLPL